VQRLLETLARSLAEEPGRVSVRERVFDDEVELELSVAASDRGRVIGRGGATAAALRTLLDAVAARQGRRCHLEILG
jgi:predicted RNA-binding protein YlqC (UPF0109 family)